MKWIITVQQERCTGCGECIDGCPGDVFELRDMCSCPVRMEECHGCHMCEDVCEEEAVHVEEVE